MEGIFTALLQEAGKNPLATFIVIAAIIIGGLYLIFVYPKRVEERKAAADRAHEDSKAIAAQMSSATEVIRHSAAVIENNSTVIANNSQTHEFVRMSIKNLCSDVGELRDKVDDHDKTAQQILNKQSELLGIVRK